MTSPTDLALAMLGCGATTLVVCLALWHLSRVWTGVPARPRTRWAVLVQGEPEPEIVTRWRWYARWIAFCMSRPTLWTAVIPWQVRRRT